MNAAPLEPGLYMVATPIGAARDVTLRALDILASADVIAAEDTRTARKLMDIHGIALGGRRLVAYHDHNAVGMRDTLLGFLQEGRSVACVSEAGTPMVSDPGFDIARAAAAAGLPVRAAPGASALLAALTVAGLPTDRFLFAGFPPSKGGARRRWLTDLASERATLVLYESPRRVAALMAELAEVMGPDRPAVVCRELTKRFEETLRGTTGGLAADLATRDGLKGEVVVVIGGAPDAPQDQDIDAMLRTALATHRTKEAAALVAEATGLPRREVYQRALDLGDGG